MKIFDWLAELRYRNALLYRLGLIHLIIFFILIIPAVIDPREVMGVNTWIKPMKFALSIGIYAWTIGWFLFDLPIAKRTRSALSWTVALTMLIENFIILYQGSRATQSHFNTSSLLDASLFGIMGIMILTNTLTVVIIFLLFLFKRPTIDSIYLMAVRMGLAVFLVSNYIGKVMIDNMAHSVGVKDGGPGLPFVNWSMEGGDLRVAHFMGLHALQIIPLFSFYLKVKTSIGEMGRFYLVIIFTLLYASIFSFLYYQAIRGIPLITLR